MNQYDIWQGLQDERGNDAIVVLKDPAKIEQVRPRFKLLEPILPQPALAVSYSGSELNSFFLYRGIGYDGSLPALPTKR